MKKIIKLLMISLLSLSLYGCSNSGTSKEDALSKSTFLCNNKFDSSNLSEEDLGWYVITGGLGYINSDSLSIYLSRSTNGGQGENYINVNLKENEDISSLIKGQAICVVAKLENNDGSYDFNNAFILSEDLYENDYFYVDIIGTKEESLVGNFYEDYTFDSNGRCTSYTVYSYSTNGSVHSEDSAVHNLSYDDEDRVSIDTINRYKTTGVNKQTAGNDTRIYTYFEGDFIDTITSNSGVQKYTYEMDSNGTIKKATVLSKDKISTYTWTYTYDENGNILSSEGLYNDKYSYSDLGYLVSITDNYNRVKRYFYGVVGAK